MDLKVIIISNSLYLCKNSISSVCDKRGSGTLLMHLSWKNLFMIISNTYSTTIAVT